MVGKERAPFLPPPEFLRDFFFSKGMSGKENLCEGKASSLLPPESLNDSYPKGKGKALEFYEREDNVVRQQPDPSTKQGKCALEWEREAKTGVKSGPKPKGVPCSEGWKGA